MHLSLPLYITDELSPLCVLQTPAFCVFSQNTGLMISRYYAVSLFTLLQGTSFQENEIGAKHRLCIHRNLPPFLIKGE